MRYKAILIDADETLMDFRSAEANAIGELFRRFSVSQTGLTEAYSQINVACWEEYEKGLLTLKALRVERFKRFSERYSPGLDAGRLADEYDGLLALQGDTLPRAVEVTKEISSRLPVAIVTNGTREIQLSRIKRAGLLPYVSGVVISEEIGSRKPEPDMLFHALRLLNVDSPSDALMIGDSLTSDMPAARNAGTDFLWYNPLGRARPCGARITYEARDISEFVSFATMT